MKKTVEERLNERIEELEDERDELETKIDELESKNEVLENGDPWQWRQMRKLTKEENLGLPLPRLELRYRKLDEFEVAIDYALVYEHLVGDIIFAPLGSTKTSGASRIKDDCLETPFRSGADILHDMWHMKLPGFVVNGINSRQLSLEDKNDLPSGLIKKMRNT